MARTSARRSVVGLLAAALASVALLLATTGTAAAAQTSVFLCSQGLAVLYTVPEPDPDGSSSTTSNWRYWDIDDLRQVTYRIGDDGTSSRPEMWVQTQKIIDGRPTSPPQTVQRWTVLDDGAYHTVNIGQELLVGYYEYRANYTQPYNKIYQSLFIQVDYNDDDRSDCTVRVNRI